MLCKADDAKASPQVIHLLLTSHWVVFVVLRLAAYYTETLKYQKKYKVGIGQGTTQYCMQLAIPA
jgi:hypothetical protein